LQEAAHRLQEVPVYELAKKEGTEHEPVFYIKVSVKNAGTAVGCGKNKKQAEQDAAMRLMEILEKKDGK